jgi:hypothetical protein
VFHDRAIHFEVDLHFVRVEVVVGFFCAKKIDSSEQLAHVLTKGLSSAQRCYICKKKS